MSICVSVMPSGVVIVLVDDVDDPLSDVLVELLCERELLLLPEELCWLDDGFELPEIPVGTGYGCGTVTGVGTGTTTGWGTGMVEVGVGMGCGVCCTSGVTKTCCGLRCASKKKAIKPSTTTSSTPKITAATVLSRRGSVYTTLGSLSSMSMFFVPQVFRKTDRRNPGIPVASSDCI